MAARQLKIKSGTLSRTRKDFLAYSKELEQEQAKTVKMKESGADAATLKQQENVTSEAAMMVPDTRRRLERAHQELQSFLDENEFEEDATEDLKSAKELLDECKTLLDAE